MPEQFEANAAQRNLKAEPMSWSALTHFPQHRATNLLSVQVSLCYVYLSLLRLQLLLEKADGRQRSRRLLASLLLTPVTSTNGCFQLAVLLQ